MNIPEKAKELHPEHAKSVVQSHHTEDIETSLEEGSQAAVDFLEWFRPSGSINLVAIPQEGGAPVGITRPARDPELRAFIEQHNGRNNLYFMVNEPKPGSPDKKLSEDEVALIHAVYTDVDPEAGTNFENERERIKAQSDSLLADTDCPPSFVINSGGGDQHFWTLDSPLDGQRHKQECKAIGAALKNMTDGDAVQNIDRIMRLPGTFNLPNKKKRDKGQTVAVASIYEMGERRYSLNDLKGFTEKFEAPNVEPHQDVLAAATQSATTIDLQSLHPDLAALIREGVPTGSRSEEFHHVVGWLKDGNYSAEAITRLLEAHPDGIAEKYEGRLDKEVKRSFDKIESKPNNKYSSPNAAVRRLNDKYFVTWAGNKVVVGRWTVYEGRRSLTLIKPADLHTWCANDRVVIDDKPVVVSRIWISSPKRRQYDGIEFAPDGKIPDGYLNIWQGFSVEPDPNGSCTLFLDHMRRVVCSGEDEIYEWVMAWLAQMIQNPGNKPGTAVVLRGGQGVGKTIVGKIIGHLFAEHHVIVSRASHITGRFNKHLNQCLLLQAEEAFWAGSRDAEGTLKDLITGETQLLEGKGVDAIPVRNVLRLLVTTNNEWAVPAGMQDRRFAVFDVSQARQQDVQYFKAMIDEMENGGYEALLHHLQNLDIEDVNLRQPPKTEALVDQVLASMPVEQSWWLEVLQQGWIMPFDKEWKAKFSFHDLHSSYTKHAKELRLSRPLTKETLGRRIRKFTTIDERRPDNTKSREYWLQPLEDCRRTFEEYLGITINWNDVIYITMDFSAPHPPRKRHRGATLEK
jgi:hypothetical protein